jgi:selenoprotein W-related protein
MTERAQPWAMTDIEIEYCVPCGFLNRAEDIQHALLSQFGEELDSVALVTGDHGVLRVDADGETVWNKADDEYDVDEIVRRMRQHI